MAKPNPITIEETSGDKFPDIRAACMNARLMLAADLAQIVKQLIENGTLEINGDQIIPRGQ